MNDAAYVLAECLDAIARRELTLDDCAARYPDQRMMLTDLIPIAQALSAAPPVVPSLDFRADARRRLIARLPSRRRASLLDRVQPNLRGHRLLFARVLIAIVVVIALSTSVIAASAQSLPNDPLYPVKIAVEQMQLALAPDRLSRGELSLSFAAERLNEVQRLIQSGRSNEASIALDGFADQIQLAASIAQSLPDEIDRDRLLLHLDTSIDQSDRVLTQTETQLPSSVQPAVQRAKGVLLSTPHRAVPPESPKPTPTSTKTPDEPTPVPSIEPTPARVLPPVISPTPDSTDVPPTSIAPTSRPMIDPTPWRTFDPTRWPTIRFTPRSTFGPLMNWRTRLPQAPTLMPPTLPSIFTPVSTPPYWTPASMWITPTRRP